MRQSNHGQSLFEVVFAVGIAALIIVGIVSLANQSLGNTNNSRDRALASRIAQDMSECLRRERDADWDTFRTSADGTCAGVPSGTQFTKAIDFSCVDDADTTVSCNLDSAFVVEATMSVSWEDGTGVHTVDSVTRLSDWKRR